LNINFSNLLSDNFKISSGVSATANKEAAAFSVFSSLVLKDNKQVTMIVDIGRTRTGVSIVESTTVHYTSTLEMGGDSFITEVQKSLGITFREADKLKQETARLNLDDNIFWMGFDKTAKSYLKAFDVFTLPSLKEGLPYTLLEAGGAGLAVVASNVGGIPEIIINEQTGLTFSPSNTEEILATLEGLVSDGSLRQKYREALREHIQKDFSIESMLKRTAEVYN